jgi:CBS domain-containing protein
MVIAEIMTREVESVPPDASLQEAAQVMDSRNVGSLPVCNGERLIGVITDRDIVVRAVALGSSPSETTVHECMTADATYAFEDEDVDAALERMKALQIRRLIVLSRAKRLVGVLALGDIATEPDAAPNADVGAAIAEISEPARPVSTGPKP